MAMTVQTRFEQFRLPLLVAVCLIACAGSADAFQGAADDAAQLFKRLDANGDGTIAADEVGETQKRFFERLLRVADANKDGALSNDEFRRGLTEEEPQDAPTSDTSQQQRRRRDVGRLFETADRNGDGRLSRDEIPAGLRGRLTPLFDRLKKDSLTRADLAQLRRRSSDRPSDSQQDGALARFRRLDRNRDGKLTIDEVPEPVRDRVRPLFERLGKDSITREEFVRASQRNRPNRSRSTTSSRSETDSRRPGQNRPGDRRPGQPGQVQGGPRIVRIIDTNQDGRISRDELAKAAELFGRLDRNKDGVLDLAELVGDVRSSSRPDGNRRPQSQGQNGGFFRRLDRNNDGKLQKNEVPDRLRQRFDALDRDEDGALSPNELRRGRRPASDSDKS